MAAVSIIMATYNCEDTIKRAIESVINQTFTDWEFIICDDCSKDSTYSILLEYKNKYPKKFIILKNEKNSKLSYSLNRCLEKANGIYIARMDGDDISVAERLEKQVKYLIEHPEYMVVGTSMIRFDENGECGLYQSIKDPNKFTLTKQVPFYHATIMMRKEAYDTLNGYSVCKRTERGQDVDLWFRFFEKGFSGNNLNEPLYKVCEDQNAYKRRKLKYCWHMTQTRFLGFKKNHFLLYTYIFVPLPLVSYFVPRCVKNFLRTFKERK